MTTIFATLCTLSITHGYYGGPCRDVAFVVPEDTAALARRGKLLLKQREGQLHVLVEQGADRKALRSIAGSVLRIGLQPTAPFFFNVTALDVSPGRTVALYANAAAAPLTPSGTATPTGTILSHVLSRADRPVTVSVADAAGRGPEAIEVDASSARPSVSFDMNGFAPGRYTVTETYEAGTATAVYYVDPALVREPLLAVVEIAIAEAFYTTAAALEVPLEARTARLRYYVVAHDYTDVEVGQLSIADKGAEEDERSPIAFTKIATAAGLDDAEKGVAAILARSARDRIVLFRSDAEVARRAGGCTKLELSRNGAALIANLPQAAADRPDSDLVIHLSKPKLTL
jgi:hypothetical protein